jgi:nicotinate-nucleotide pyrophosphorylase (carboxylating)
MERENSFSQAMLVDAIKKNITSALEEDLGKSDITSNLLKKNIKGQVQIKTKEKGILCGKAWVDECFKQIDKNIKITWLVEDGESIRENQLICVVEGFIASILMGERVALNFLQLLSGTATSTAHFKNLVRNTSAKIFDTRKTIPGLRIAQKYAVLIGGGHNQRIGLFDQILLKENHKNTYDSIGSMLKNIEHIEHIEHIQVEVENIKELKEALSHGVKNILLDNFSVEDCKKSVELNHGEAMLEASGNIDEKNILHYARTGVDRISIGAITKNIRSIDFSMLFSPQKPL